MSSLPLLLLLALTAPEPPPPAELPALPPHAGDLSTVPETKGRPVTFDEALGLAVAAPAVEGARNALAAQRDLAGRVGPVVANPYLEAQPGLVRDPLTGTLTWFGEATLRQDWNLSGLPGARKGSLAAEEAQLRADARQAALSHRLAAAQAWTELWAAQQSLADALQEYELAREFAGKMERAAAAQAYTRAEAADALSYAAEAHVQAIAAEGDVTEQGFRLAIAMGQAAEHPLVASGDLPLPQPPARTGWPALLEAAGRLPAVDARRLASDAERARQAEARSTKGFILGTGVKVTRDIADTWGVQAVLGFTIPIADGGEREAAPYAAGAARLEGEAREARAVAATELARALHEVEHTGETLAALERELLPAARMNVEAKEASMKAGDATVLEVLVARRLFVTARAKRTRALAANDWARVKVWMLLTDVGREAK